MSNECSSSAEKSILKYTMVSAGVGVIPMTFVDIALLTGIQLKMIQRLSTIYEVSFSKDLAKSIIASLVGSSIPASFSSNLVSLVPGYGMAVGIISRSVLGCTSTYAIGTVFRQHFESGGTLLSFDAEKIQAYYQQQLKINPSDNNKNFEGIAP